MNKIPVQIACLLPLVAILAGCALTTDKIDLSYNMRGARDKMAGAGGIKVQVTAEDKRLVRDKVGKKINGYGQEKGAIVSTTDVVELVRSAIEMELTARGFSKGDSVLVTCDLNKFNNHFKTGFWAGDSLAAIDLGIQVKNHEGGIVFTKDVMAEGLEANVQMAGGHNAKAALEQALAKAIENLFQDPAFLPSLYKAAGVASP
jgi:uncharacterized lipoprotein